MSILYDLTLSVDLVFQIIVINRNTIRTFFFVLSHRVLYIPTM